MSNFIKKVPEEPYILDELKKLLPRTLSYGRPLSAYVSRLCLSKKLKLGVDYKINSNNERIYYNSAIPIIQEKLKEVSESGYSKKNKFNKEINKILYNE